MKFLTDSCLSKIVILLRLFGFWKSKPHTWCYSIYSMAYLFIFSICSTFFMFLFLWHLEDYGQLSYGLYMFLSQISGLVKFVYFHLRNFEFRNFIDRINNFTVHGDSEKELIARRCRFFNRVTAFYNIMVVLAIHNTVMMTIFSEGKKLPYSSWYPMLDWQNSARDYWIAIVYQYIAVFSVCTLIINIEVYINFLIFAVGVQLEIIGHRLRAIGFTDKGFSRENVENAQQLEWEQTQRLINCIELHIEVSDLKNRIEHCSNVPFFIQAIASGIVLSSVVNELAQVSRTKSIPACLDVRTTILNYI